jgi:hypothetical protein
MIVHFKTKPRLWMYTLKPTATMYAHFKTNRDYDCTR